MRNVQIFLNRYHVSLGTSNKPDSHLNRTVHVAGEAAELAADATIRKYADLSRAFVFVPVAVETLGPICSVGEKFVTELGRRDRKRLWRSAWYRIFVSKDFYSGSEGQCCSCIGSSEVGFRLKLKYRSSRRFGLSHWLLFQPSSGHYNTK